ncbi:MAG TPA: DUF805 domain-containing protein [Ramlibacter sp.]|jgi:uncharacterized membrane protein YhaH (DUF805 family)|uniref:DUF805 domain-containing protein n=1 Tax=Ramlibacter sp. TaxID=1917967 RepID=UPI002D409B8E|nr:DUF805 domain-containing protein [Ramlibacter sp.]HZY19728.1 DUF805 domain-containing protein [Ramlibacter sp.]
MDEFQQAAKTCFRKYTDFTGRAARPEFWWFFLLQLAVYIVASMVHGLVYLVAVLALLLPAIAVGVRRLHDTGKSGWFMLIGLIPLVGLILLYFFAQPSQQGDNAWGSAPTGPAGELAPGQQ